MVLELYVCLQAEDFNINSVFGGKYCWGILEMRTKKIHKMENCKFGVNLHIRLIYYEETFLR